MNKKIFNQLTSKEKENFLNNDLIERVIKVEQRVSSKFGRLLHYNSTEIYKSLTPEQKKNYESYIKNKGRRRVLVSCAFLFPIILISLFNLSFTGNVVSEDLVSYGLFDYLFLFVVTGVFVFVFLFYYFRRKRNKKLEGYFRIVDSAFFNNS